MSVLDDLDPYYREMPVDSSVCKSVGDFVPLSIDMSDNHFAETGPQLRRFVVQEPQFGVFHLEPAIHLLDDDLGVETYVEAVWVEGPSSLQTFDQRPVLGLVVGCHTYVSAVLVDSRPAVVLNHDADACVARIAARSTIGEQAESLEVIHGHDPRRIGQKPEGLRGSPGARTFLASNAKICTQLV
jgi:hypothetical protein